MGEDRPRYTVWIDAPAGWLPIPPAGTDPGPWAAQTAAQLWDLVAPDQATPQRVATSAADFAGRARECQTRTWIHALMRFTAPDQPPAIVAELQQLVPEGPDDPFTADAFAAELSKRGRRAVVSRVALPAGPAVRCLRPIRGPRAGLRRAELTQVVHGIFPPLLPREGLVLLSTGAGLAAGSPALAEVEELARRISVELLT